MFRVEISCGFANFLFDFSYGSSSISLHQLYISIISLVLIFWFTISKDEHGNKMINEYVRECKIGSGSYGKVVSYRYFILPLVSVWHISSL